MQKDHIRVETNVGSTILPIHLYVAGKAGL